MGSPHRRNSDPGMIDDLDLFPELDEPSGEARTSTRHITERATRTRHARLEALRAIKLETYAATVEHLEPLTPGDTIHTISRGQFDTITILAYYAHTIGKITRLTASSLSISRQSIQVLQLLEANDLLGEARIAVQDLTMKRSEHREHIDAIRGWMHAGHRHTLRCAETHAKVYVLEFDEHPPIVVESSANLTSNDNRLEQYTITSSVDLAAFHLDWLDEIFGYPDGKLPRNAFPGDERLAGPA